MHKKVSWLALFIATAAMAMLIARPAGQGSLPEPKQETAFERVMRTQTIRCGYAVWNPVFYKDMQSGELKGFSHDLMEAVGEKLGLKVEWAEESTWGTVVEGLSTHRYDAVCSGLGIMARRARVSDFSMPFAYTALYLVVRADETRIKKADDLDNEAYSLTTLEGEGFSHVAPLKFPKAKIKALPQNSDFSAIFQDVETQKADATGVDYSTFLNYDKLHPGKLKVLDKSNLLFVYPISFGLPQGDVALKTMIDAALVELQLDGTFERVIRAYTTDPNEFLLPSKPYVLPAP